MKRYDVIVIGSGPGGEGAAMTAAKAGHSVAIVDKQTDIGGGCVHWGTIPSKMLRHAIQQYVDFRSNDLFAPAMRHLSIEYPQLLGHVENVVSKQQRMRRGFYERNDVLLFDGHARFVDPHTIEVRGPNGVTDEISADHFVIAVGTRPWRPEPVDFDHPRILDSDTVLELQETPSSITIYGAGVIGCEYASIFRNLDCKVNLINTRDQLLEFLDDEIIDALSYHLRDQGALIRHNEVFERVETHDDGC